jgi:hypothetical protein
MKTLRGFEAFMAKPSLALSHIVFEINLLLIAREILISSSFNLLSWWVDFLSFRLISVVIAILFLRRTYLDADHLFV